MKTWMKNVLSVMLILIGLAAIMYGEIDDSPGGMFIGLIVVMVSLFTLVKQFFKKK